MSPDVRVIRPDSPTPTVEQTGRPWAAPRKEITDKYPVPLSAWQTVARALPVSELTSEHTRDSTAISIYLLMLLHPQELCGSYHVVVRATA